MTTPTPRDIELTMEDRAKLVDIYLNHQSHGTKIAEHVMGIRMDEVSCAERRTLARLVDEAIALARAEEREACAVICDSFFSEACGCPRCHAGKDAAYLIRARTQGAPDAKPE